MLIGLLLIVPIAIAQTSHKGPAGLRLVVKGTLQRPDGSPAAGVKVYLFPYLDGKLSTWLKKVEEQWEIANPIGYDGRERTIYNSLHRSRDHGTG
jgi:hypothetical protein